MINNLLLIDFSGVSAVSGILFLGNVDAKEMGKKRRSAQEFSINHNAHFV